MCRQSRPCYRSRINFPPPMIHTTIISLLFSLSLDLRRLITSDKACTVAISGYEVYLVGLEINSGRFEGGGTRLEPRTGVCRRDNGQVGTYSCGIRSVGKRANSIEFDLDRPPSRLDLLSRAAIQSIKLIIIAVGTRNAAGCATFPGNCLSRGSGFGSRL